MNGIFDSIHELTVSAIDLLRNSATVNGLFSAMSVSALFDPSVMLQIYV